MPLDNDSGHTISSAICKIKNVPNKTKMLRLLHGDVYCGAGIKKFSMSDNDCCIRCFEEETIPHLLLMCPYTKEVWQIYGFTPGTVSEVMQLLIDTDAEILAEIVIVLVFCKNVKPQHVLVRNTIKMFAEGLSKNNK